MATKAVLDRARSSASMEATRLHQQLGVPFDAPIDVLGIARDLDLVLMMQPLETLLGFYVRSSEASGIVINSLVPESLQRFTLAHEIGHHVLGHEGTLDDTHSVDRFDQDNLVEVQAQAFAGALLMPLPLVNRALRELPSTAQGRAIRATDAYLFSRQLGVSFTAGVWALYRHQRVSLRDARRFIKDGALAAKSGLTGGQLTEARADVWVLTEENDDLTVLCRIGDEIHVQLAEDISTGYTWSIREPRVADFYDPSTARNELSWDGHDTVELTNSDDAGALTSDVTVEVILDEHRPSTPVAEDLFAAPPDELSFPAAAGVREITFVPIKAGPTSVEIALVRRWDADGDPIQRYALELAVRSRQLAGAGLLAPERDAWVDEHAAIA